MTADRGVACCEHCPADHDGRGHATPCGWCNDTLGLIPVYGTQAGPTT